MPCKRADAVYPIHILESTPQIVSGKGLKIKRRQELVVFDELLCYSQV